MSNLTGRHSLIRLIGKRRRYLPNRERLLSMPIQSSINLFDYKNDKTTSIESTDGRGALKSEEYEKCVIEEAVPSNWVTCPVCGSRVYGGDDTMNSHLDACLSRRTKRKLTQRTLLQFDFGSPSKVQILSTRPKQLDTSDLHTSVDSCSEEKAAVGVSNLSEVEENDTKQSTVLLDQESVEPAFQGDTTESASSDDSCCKVDNSFSSISTLLEPNVDERINEIYGVALDTFIVGFRSGDEKELTAGVGVCLRREPDNARDHNAIQVLYADSGSCDVLGYLPKELAQHLSPLIDKYKLNFEGQVASIPQRSFKVIPIQIVCKTMMPNDQDEQKDIGDFKLLWKKVLEVVESVGAFPLSKIKYQQNFKLLLSEVLESCRHLLTADEKSLLESFTSLSEDSQRLFVRLYTRKGPWFRLANIFYPEISDIQQATKELIATGFMKSFEDAKDILDNDIKEILDLLLVSELRDIMSVVNKNFRRGSRKQDLVQSLHCSYKDGRCRLLPNIILDRTGVCIRISAKTETLVWRAERLFFMNGEQDLSSFILVDLGKVKYPTYKCIVSEQIFPSQADLLAYEEAIEVAQMMDESLEENNTETVLRCIMIADSRLSSSSTKATESTTSKLAVAFSSSFTAPLVYSKVVLLGVSYLECERRYNHAIHLLKRLLACFNCDRRRGYWTLRLSIDLGHIGCPNESLTVVEEGLSDPWVRAGSRMAIQKRILLLGKPPRRWKTPSFAESIKRKIPEVWVQGRPLNCEIGVKSRFYGEDGEQCGVEQLALQYYAGDGGGWQGVHTESGIWLTIFGLLMWDILFADVPNVFRTRFQTAPLDLDTDSFYPARESLIESHLQKFSNGIVEDVLIKSWESHYGTACRGVNWDRHSLPELLAAVSCVGGTCLASLCRNLAQDYRSWSGGMPDLLLWRFHGNYCGEAKLVEVKGPRDRLSEQQRAWLLLLMDCGFNTEVCRVSPAQPDT